MELVYNSNSTMYLPALMQIRVARETGWDGIFLRQEHLERYLAQGYGFASLRDALLGLRPVNLGALPDVERWRPDERASMLREAETELRKVLPQFDSSKLIGANMDVFHKNPAHQRQLLKGISGTHRATVKIGGAVSMVMVKVGEVAELPAPSSLIALIWCGPSLCVGRVNSVVELAVPCATCTSSTSSLTSEPDSAVTSILGTLIFVRLSVLKVPVSAVAIRSGRPGGETTRLSVKGTWTAALRPCESTACKWTV